MPCHKRKKVGKRKKVIRVTKKGLKHKPGRYYKTKGGHMRRLGGLTSKKRPPKRK